MQLFLHLSCIKKSYYDFIVLAMLNVRDFCKFLRFENALHEWFRWFLFFCRALYQNLKQWDDFPFLEPISCPEVGQLCCSEGSNSVHDWLWLNAISCWLVPLLRNTCTGLICWYFFNSQRAPVVQQVKKTKRIIAMSFNPAKIRF